MRVCEICVFRQVTVQTMRPELGPRVVNLSSTLVDVRPVWDGEAMVDATIWAVQISGVQRRGSNSRSREH